MTASVIQFVAIVSALGTIGVVLAVFTSRRDE